MAKGFQKGHKKTGGKVKGVVNKEKQALIDLINQEFPGYSPVVAMAKIANNELNELSIRFNAHKEVAQYVHPKLKSIEHSNKDGDPFIVQVIRFGGNNNTK